MKIRYCKKHLYKVFSQWDIVAAAQAAANRMSASLDDVIEFSDVSINRIAVMEKIGIQTRANNSESTRCKNPGSKVRDF